MTDLPPLFDELACTDIDLNPTSEGVVYLLIIKIKEELKCYVGKRTMEKVSVGLEARQYENLSPCHKLLEVCTPDLPVTKCNLFS